MTLTEARALLLGFAGLDGTTRLPGVGATPLDAQLACINMARRRLCRRLRTSFNYTSDHFTVLAGAASAALPDLVSAIESVHYAPVVGEVTTLNAVPSLNRFRALYPTGIAPGTLVDYAVQGRNVLFGPPPAGALQVDYDYWGLLPDLAETTNDTDAFMDHCYELVIFEALAQFVPIYTLEDSRQAIWTATRDELLRDFLDEQANLASSDGPAYMEIPG